MTDKNGTPITAGCWIHGKPDGQDEPRIGMVTGVTGTGVWEDSEVKPTEAPEVQAYLAGSPFEGGQGSGGGGGATVQW